MKILVTGGSGFVGKVLVARLEKEGHHVVSLCRSAGGGVQCNLLNLKQSEKVLEKYNNYDCIVHTAALAHGQSPPDGHSIDEVNLRMTQVLANAMDGFRGMVLFLSSTAVYGVGIGTEKVSLSLVPQPVSAYGKGKFRCEQYLRSQGFISYHCLRLPPLYDENHMSDIKKRVYFPGQSFFKMALIPSPIYSFLSVSSLAEKVVRLIQESREGAWLHLISDPEPKLQSDLLKNFPGLQIPIPLWLVSPIKIASSLLPAHVRRKIDEAYAKLFMNSFYRSESVKLHEDGHDPE